mmetsp:Transcript_56956/g.90230  ORF Transcript_56956/g.90230 Transcript_56956/m.90230 type:complete len:203 (-) Transcript_56956:143-751(-)
MDLRLNETILLQLLIGLNSSLLHDAGLVEADGLLDDVDLHQSPRTHILVLNGTELFSVHTVHVANVAQPVRQGRRVVVVPHRCADAAAVVVSTEHDVLNLQDANGILNDTHGRCIHVVHQIRNVPVDEECSRRKTANGPWRHAAVTTTYPQISRLLRLGGAIKKAWIALHHRLSPLLVAVDEFIDGPLLAMIALLRSLSGEV